MAEYGSLTTKFQDKSSFCEGTRSPARGRLYIKNRKITQHSSHNPFDKYIDHKSSFAVKHFGNRNNFFLLLTISIHNVFEGKIKSLNYNVKSWFALYFCVICNLNGVLFSIFRSYFRIAKRYSRRNVHIHWHLSSCMPIVTSRFLSNIEVLGTIIPTVHEEAGNDFSYHVHF